MTPLSPRKQRLLKHTCALYKPSTLAPLTNGDIEAADVAYARGPAYNGVICYYEPTPEFDERTGIGLNKELNIFTADKWNFLQGQEIADGWLIVMTTLDHPYAGRCWVVQGNSLVNASMPGRPADTSWVYAKLSPTSLIPR